MYPFISRKFTASLVVILVMTAPALAQVTIERESHFEPTYESYGSVEALSGTGSIAAGYMNKENNHQDAAIIWTVPHDLLGDDGEFLTGLETDDNYDVAVNALSHDGSIAGGFAQKKNTHSNMAVSRATIWSSSNNNWSNPLDLGAPGNFKSEVNALSEDGETAAGWITSAASNHSSHAAIWTTKDRWATVEPVKDLGTFTSDNSGYSEVHALSADGSIAGGNATANTQNGAITHAAIWTTKDEWDTVDLKKDLGTLENHLSSSVSALSRDGKTAGGSSRGQADVKAVIWTTTDEWKTVDPIKDLGTLKANDSGFSEVFALSADGSVAGGQAASDSGSNHAVLWSGEDFLTKTDLGVGSVRALSDDAIIAGGWSRNSSGNYRATLWRLSYPSSTDTSSTNPSSTDTSSTNPSSTNPFMTTPALAQVKVENRAHLGARYGSIEALSGTGSIAAGYIYNENNRQDAAIWTVSNDLLGDDGEFLTGLETDDNYDVAVNALSHDGSIAGGFAQKKNTHSNMTVSRATIWSSSNNNWSNPLDLGAPGNFKSEVNALSEDGETAAGWITSAASNHSSHAAIWTTKDRWATVEPVKDLGTFTSDNSGYSEVHALSADGSIAGGYATANTQNGAITHAAIWTTTDEWDTVDLKKDLGTLENHLSSSVSALSRDGKTAGGSSRGQADAKAVIWTTTDEWKTVDPIKDLGTLKANDSGFSEVFALSADGSVAGGQAASDSGRNHAVLWSGEDFLTKTDLGVGSVRALSDDATIAGGFSTNGSGNYRASLWRLSYPSSTNPSPTNPSPTNPSPTNPSPTNPTVIATIDTANTQASVAQLASNSFATIEQQRLGLGRLQDGCDINRAGKSCHSLGVGASGFDGATDVYIEAAFGHAFSDNLSSGVTITNTFSGLGNLPGNLKRDGINPGAGIWGKWREATRDGHWYLRGTAAANRAKIKRSRSGFSGIEPGTGTSTINGWSVATELGRVHEITRKTNVGYYGGLRHSNVHLSGYTETRAPGFPFSWSDATSSRTTAYAGARYHIGSDKEAFSWAIRAELERDLNYKDPAVTAQADGGMRYDYQSDLAHTRGILSTDFSYSFSDAAILSLSPFLRHSANDQTVYGAMLKLSGYF